MKYLGSCHCKNLRIEYESEVPPARWPLRACQCSFCRAHGVMTTSHPDAGARLLVADKALHQVYRFGLKVTDFHICSRCGVYVLAVSRHADREYAVVVANVLDCRAELTRKVQPVVYDDEAPDTRLARRAQRWAKFYGLTLSS